MAKLFTALTFLGALVCATGLASADGAPAAPRAAASPFSWTGFYAGIHGGAAWTGTRLLDIDGYNGGAGSFSHDVEGGFFGVQLGYNAQMQNILVGVEGDVGKMLPKDQAQFPPFAGIRTPFDSVDSVEINRYATITGRLGFLPWNSVLVYGKAGWGWAHTNVNFRDTDAAGTTLVTGTSADGNLSGAVWGGGIEIAMADNVSVKLEYLRFNFGDTITHTATNNVAVPFRFGHQIDDIDTLKIGFNMKFDSNRYVPGPLK